MILLINSELSWTTGALYSAAVSSKNLGPKCRPRVSAMNVLFAVVSALVLDSAAGGIGIRVSAIVVIGEFGERGRVVVVGGVVSLSSLIGATVAGVAGRRRVEPVAPMMVVSLLVLLLSVVIISRLFGRRDFQAKLISRGR